MFFTYRLRIEKLRYNSEHSGREVQRVHALIHDLATHGCNCLEIQQNRFVEVKTHGTLRKLNRSLNRF